MESFIYVGIGVGVGIYLSYVHIKLKILDAKIDKVREEFPDTVDIAKEILNVKLPMDELPKETVDMLNKDRGKDNYFG